MAEAILANQMAPFELEANEYQNEMNMFNEEFQDNNEAPEKTRSALYSAVVESKIGRKVVGGLTASAVIAPLGAALGAEAAGATDVPASENTTTMVVRNAQVKVSDVASKKVIVGEDVRIKVDKKNANNCVWTKPGQTWTNSVRLANGKLYYYPESTKAKICKDVYSPTGWVKKAGGKTGRNCGNPAKLTPMPEKPNVKVINVRDLDTSFVLRALAIAKGSVECPGASVSGYARAEAKQRFNLRSFLKMKGQAQVHTGMKIYDKAYASAELKLHCDSTTTTTTTTPKPPTPPTPPIKTKDGTQTPTPPVEAPGPNPAPSPNEPYPGGYKCYDETNGAPVTPRNDGTCPAGSFGS